ncbi:Uncharacterised protein [uncultured archaeon]|nr:Uncharacterised protein [uncultured archaeon]
MKNKIIGTFVCMLLIVTAVPTVDSLKNSMINSTVSTTFFSTPVIGRDQNPILLKKITSVQNNNSGPYEGRLRVYLVQPLSKWKNHDGKNYHFSLLDFPFITDCPLSISKFDEDISIEYLDTYSKTVNWHGFINKNNVMIIAGVYDARSEIKYNYKNENPFYAHYLDAAAGARPEETAFNTVNENFTHTVLVDVETSTKCPVCPIMEEALSNLYKTGEYPFYFINMVSNKNKHALYFMFDHQEGYSQAVSPEAYFDGGYEILVGGENDTNSYIQKIKSCGKRDVHDLNLSLSVAWKGYNTLEISIRITNNEEVHYPLKPVAPVNLSDVFRKGKQYIFTSSTTDPDGDDVLYMFEYMNYWGDVTYNSGWLGPYHSGDVVNTTLSWNTRELYYIRVIAKDIHNEVSPRSEYTSIDVG